MNQKPCRYDFSGKQVLASLLLLATLLGFWLGLTSESVELSQAELIAILAGLGGLGSYIWKQSRSIQPWNLHGLT